MTIASDDVHIRKQGRPDLSAVCRCWEGIFDVRCIDGEWICSCSKGDCSHVARVQEWLVPS